MKQAIENLLHSIEADATQASHRHHAAIVRQAFGAGVFDCLVSHLASEPPNNDRCVLIEHTLGDGVSSHGHGVDWWNGKRWANTRSSTVLRWWELP